MNFAGTQVRSFYRKKTAKPGDAPLEVVKTYVKDKIRYVTCRTQDVVLFDMPYAELQRDYVRVEKP